MITGINTNGYEYSKSRDGIGTTITLKRADNGAIILDIQDATAAEIEGVGTVSGTGQISFATTDDDEATVFEYTHTGDSENNFELANINEKHYNIKGEKAYITSEGGNAARTIQVDGAYSVINLEKAGGSQFVYMSEESHDNRTYLGYGNNNYIDAGKFNYVHSKGGTSRYETTVDSYGAAIVAGSGNDTIIVGGKYGVIDAGAGADTIKALGLFGQTDNSSYRNIILGSEGDDTMEDKGGYNIFFGGKGSNTYVANGQSGIAYLGSDSEDSGAIIGSSADKSYIFASDEITSKTGTVYNLYTIMRRYNWTLTEFLNVYSQMSAITKDSIASHGMIDNETMAKLNEYFINNMQKTS